MRKRFTKYDAYLFGEGTHYEVYERLGAHPCVRGGEKGVLFGVWAPNARIVSLISSRNGWDPLAAPMEKGEHGVWELFVPGMEKGDSYKYVVVGADGVSRYKADPFAFWSELRPSSASVVWPLKGYRWGDSAYMKKAAEEDPVAQPMSIYEVHLGSWKKDYRENQDGFLNYRRLADELSEYVKFLGFTHVELIGICEHPFDGSWGYQVTVYYSPTSRYGSPDDFRYFVDKMHREGIGVILDWVPAHYPKDEFGLEHFDGTPLFDSADPLLAEYPEWGTMAFDHSKPEVRSFLISDAFYWIKEFHIDALRVDAVAAMLFTNFSRDPWRPNKYGGSENLDSIDFLKQLNDAVTSNTQGYLIAEDSSIMAGVTKPVSEGGMGFLFKWNLGWMNDTLKYLSKEPVYRGYHHYQLTHSIEYAFTENFVLVLSHDEVVHLKHSMLEKLPGSTGDKLAGLKTLYAYQFTSPGKKLLFMGQEFADPREWIEDRDIAWGLTHDEWHRDVLESLRSLARIYRSYPCLYSDGPNPVTFEWVNDHDMMRNTLSYIRRNPWNWNGALLVVLNFSAQYYEDYDIGVPVEGWYKRIYSSYDSMPGEGGAEAEKDIPPLVSRPEPCDHYENRISYKLRTFEAAIFELPHTEL